jgi:CheY-like chemotaxis protein
VKDYGAGIKKQDLKRIFQPFHQASADTERLYGGTGLGLAITSKLVTAMGGTISADSEEGKWTKFTVDFPFLDACANPQDISMRFKNVTVFLIHTEPEVIARFHVICCQYQVRTVNFSNMDEMDYCVKRDSSFDRDRHYICLVHEDLYRPEPYECLVAAAKSVLLTFGPKFSVKESKGHYRSLLQVIPSVLMHSMSAYLEPLALSSQTVANDSSRSFVPVSYADLKVLVAEDNLINQKVLLRMLKKLGLTRVDMVDNGQKAVDQEALEEYDIVLMDMQMPVMDGVEACRLIVERHDKRPKPKVVFVTAHVENSFKLEAARAGSSGYLSKPFNIKEIEKCFQMLGLGSCPANTIFPP